MERKRKCMICERTVSRTSEHHLIPRSRHRNKKMRKTYGKERMKATVPVCAPCNSMIHSTFSEKELAREFNTVEALQSEPRMAKFLAWLRRRPNEERVRSHPPKS